MKRTPLASCVLCFLLVGGAHAQIDYDNPTIAVSVSRAQIQTASTLGVTGLQTLAFDTAGRLLFFDEASNSSADGGLWQADVSGPTPALTKLATEAQVVAATGADSGGTFTVAPEALLMHPTNATIYLAQSTNTDDFISVVPGSPSPTVTNIREANGFVGMTLNAAGTDFVITQEQFLLAPNQDLVKFPITGGSPTTIATEAAIKTVSGGSDIGASEPVRNSAGDFLFFDELSQGGADEVLRVTEAGVVSVFIAAGSFPGGNSPSLDAITVDSNDTLYMWNEAPASPGTPEITIREASGTFHSISAATINTALGTGTFDVDNNGLAARVVSPTQVELFAAEVTGDKIVKFTFTGTSGVRDWVLME